MIHAQKAWMHGEKTTTWSPDGHFSPLFPSLIKYQVSRGAITGTHTLSFLYMSSRFKPVTHFRTQTQLFNDQCRNLDPLSHRRTHTHTRAYAHGIVWPQLPFSESQTCSSEARSLLSLVECLWNAQPAFKVITHEIMWKVEKKKKKKSLKEMTPEGRRNSTLMFWRWLRNMNGRNWAVRAIKKA